MNVLTLIGAATVCKEFCELLFDNPLKAAQLLGLFLTRADLEELRKMFNKQNRDEVCGHFGGIRTLICHHPPCTSAPIILGHEDFCT